MKKLYYLLRLTFNTCAFNNLFENFCYNPNSNKNSKKGYILYNTSKHLQFK